MPNDRMDENTAWQNFTQTGRVSDYLAYCRVKLGYPPEVTCVRPEEKNEKGNRGTDTDRNGCW